MGDTSATKVTAIPTDVAALRDTFNADRTRPLATRKRLLRQILALVNENEKELCAALKVDLNRHPHEGFYIELNMIKSEVQEHLDYLDDWAAPRAVSTPMACFPGHSSLVAEPLGVVLVFGTWNYPIYTTLLPLAGILSAGNCAYIRLAADGSTDATNAVLAKLLPEYLDRDFVRVARGGLDVSKACLAQRYDLIFCTGSERIGKIIARAAAETLTPTVLELGGKTPTIVDETADLDVSARRIAWGAFLNAGQTCVRPDHVFVSETVGDAFVDLLKHHIVSLFSSDPETFDTYGRVVNQMQVDKMAQILAADAAYIVHGGQVTAATRFVAPTVLNFGSDHAAFDASAAMADEIFGPILPVVYYRDVPSVIAAIRRRPKPLSLYVFSRTQATIDAFLERTSSGSFCINDDMLPMSNHNLPHGNVGLGRYHGKFSFETFSHDKGVLRKYFALDLPQRYMPYSDLDTAFVRFVTSPIPRAVGQAALGVAIAVPVAAVAYAAFNHVPETYLGRLRQCMWPTK
ncbi:Aste57867_13749 [Aphanomyces stellatus]|uniref:Aldehyde dehydrogenase n=1 Tax=Aphanomyces stellatus TaxID=120398 RepID=A0A485KZN3_9STRA|nr:hypothetical protein As57867_013699 [Aphanomyces stellatus]VFT90582.1 Aste57867_13749 [Aphanomyces stellatus]